MLAFVRCLLLAVAIFVSTPTTSDASDQPISNWLTLGQISERVKAALPPGTRLPAVENYFSKNRIGYGYSKKDSTVFAMVRNIWGGFPPVDKDAQIVVHLADNDTVQTIDVRAVFIGP
jgi:hypothetical protein